MNTNEQMQPTSSASRSENHARYIEAVKLAMTDAMVPSEYRAHIIGYLCNHLNSLQIVPTVVQAPDSYKIRNSDGFETAPRSCNSHNPPVLTEGQSIVYLYKHAAPIVATVQREPIKVIALSKADGEYVLKQHGYASYTLTVIAKDGSITKGDLLYAAPSPTEQSSEVRNALIDECALVADNAICTCCWSEDAQAAATHISDEIRLLKSATPADKGNAP